MKFIKFSLAAGAIALSGYAFAGYSTNILHVDSPIQEPSKVVAARVISDALDTIQQNLNNLYAGDGIKASGDVFSLDESIKYSWIGQHIGRLFNTNNQNLRDDINLIKSQILPFIVVLTGHSFSYAKSQVDYFGPSGHYEVTMKSIDNFRKFTLGVNKSDHPALATLNKRPTAGDIVNGHEFIGGNEPGRLSSWKEFDKKSSAPATATKEEWRKILNFHKNLKKSDGH